MSGKQGTQPKIKERLAAMEKENANLQMAVKIMQMTVQQLMTSFQAFDQDLTQAGALLNNLEYRTQAMIDLSSIDRDMLNATADGLKLVDYNTASDKEDTEKNYIVTDVIADDSVVILTTKVEGDTDNGIFRSKIILSELTDKTLHDNFLGKVVGDKFDSVLNGLNHTIEIVGIRLKPELILPETPELAEEAGI